MYWINIEHLKNSAITNYSERRCCVYKLSLLTLDNSLLIFVSTAFKGVQLNVQYSWFLSIPDVLFITSVIILFIGICIYDVRSYYFVLLSAGISIAGGEAPLNMSATVLWNKNGLTCCETDNTQVFPIFKCNFGVFLN